jgi:hypothetical protein
MKYFQIRVIVSFLFLTITSCNNTPINFLPEPKIEFLYIKDSIIEQREIVDIYLKLYDGDGKNDWDNDNIFNYCINLCLPIDTDTNCTHLEKIILTIDNRTGCRIPTLILPSNIVSLGKGTNAISANLRVRIGPICCIYADNSDPCFPHATITGDTLYGTIQITDKDKNYSNKLDFGPIFIDCTKYIE